MSLPVTPLESVRHRPMMYIGNTRFFGFIHYLVSGFDFLLHNGPTWIEVETPRDGPIRLRSDVVVPLVEQADGALAPFEVFDTVHLDPRRSPDAVILAALSETLHATIDDGATRTTLAWQDGKRTVLERAPSTGEDVGTRLEFVPDFSIFDVEALPTTVMHSYCRRNAVLYPGVAFRIRGADGAVTEYRSERGIRDFFDAVALPYQLLYEPIHLRETDGELTVELVFVFHSWSEHRIWSFANKGRVPDGGTHEAGMMDAIARLHHTSERTASTGVLAVLAIEYPHVTFEGCIKARIGNPELRERVAELVRAGLKRWYAEHEDDLEYLAIIERFQFVDSW